MRILLRGFPVFLLLLASAAPSTQAEEVWYVSPDGDDSWSGRLAEPSDDGADGPFSTLERARDAVRAHRRKHPETVADRTVLIREGTYFLDRPFMLGPEDSGAPESRTIFRSKEGERVRLQGGKEISEFRPVSDRTVLERIPPEARGNVVVCDLAEEGITDFGVHRPRGFGRSARVAALELFLDDQPMRLARWPNEGWRRIAAVPHGATAGRFNYEGDRSEKWLSSKDIWLHGYWTWDWADSYVGVADILPMSMEFVTREPHGVYGYKEGRRFYALNLLEELDSPGEWFLDRLTGALYFWPPSPIGEGKAFVSLTESLISVDSASHVSVENVTLEFCRGTACLVRGGEKNLLRDCVIRNVGTDAVRVEGGRSHQVAGCEIYGVGEGGIYITGGDRKTLEPGKHEVLENHIHHYSRWVKTYRPAVSVAGVGNRVAHNLIHHAPHNGILLSGNEHVIEYNEIHHVCQETGDAGAFYMGRDWTQRGNIIRYNFFHHLGGLEVDHEAFTGVIAIYLDDWTSGTTVFGNVCYKTNYGVLIGGGRDNLVENNVFVDCAPAVHVDSRGLGWAKNYFDGTTTTLEDRLQAMNYRELPYSERYPELLTLYEDDPAVAKGNRIARNVSVGGRWLDLRNGLTEEVVRVEDNFTQGDPEFANPEEFDFRLREDSPVFETGFQRIPLEEIGLTGSD